MVLALVLGPILENSFRQSLFMGQGSPLIFIRRPISALLIGASAAVLVAPPAWRAVKPIVSQGEQAHG